MTDPTKPLRAVTYNTYCGGLDSGDDARLRRQVEMLRNLKPDLLCIQEAQGWTNRHLCQVADAVEMVPVTMAPSRVRRDPGPPNGTVVLYAPSALQLMDWCVVGKEAFHHALIQARLRPRGAKDDQRDFVAFGTHLAWSDGDRRLAEVRFISDYGGTFPGAPGGAVLLGDLNTPDREPPDWSLIPSNLHSRYRLVGPGGEFGGADRRAVQVLLESGWQDPQRKFGDPAAATVGYFYRNEPVFWRLDYVLTSGYVKPVEYFIWDTAAARKLSDHLPVVCDVTLGLAA
ncbi:endonuclease/exonuclease/phosphatase family protein [Streptomyces griseofuscus]|uniref:Endonuclease/Exonuclease/phosphatase family protein n=1 Tax=Streptomyces griseofuscus TaxID=146922 RepID=A0A7H1Q3V0_9ACTN|nr:endonuclease/exonuclease/phosphatase family protein [Streptomyces griseofuscus]QNT94980.1 Endonuclease/Exonuclease/phosphatase family protein [Streptomyces griseofuscus]